MAMKQKRIGQNLTVMISVVIPVRNEEKSIPNLITKLQAQNYPLFEVIIVDDNSNDGTNKVAKADARFKIINSSGQGKKAALATGIAEAGGKIIVTTDADCSVTIGWLKAIADSFCNDTLKLAFGGVRIQESNSFFSHCQVIEFTGLIGSGAATLMLGFPSMCNGANLAFRKEIYEEVGGYADNLHIPSGDDEFLLRKVYKKYPGGVAFINSLDSVVSTTPQLSLSDFLNQRIRWAGKWRYHNTFFSKLLALVIFIFQLTSILTVIYGLVGMLSLRATLVLWGIKFVIEYIYLKKVSLFLGSSWRWLPFMLLQIVYPFYVVCIGLISNFMPFVWKGRRLKSIHLKSISDS